jgi:DNA-binding response OmpR family regulator
MIIEFVWGYDREYDNSLKTHISRLGKKLSAVTGGKHIINKRSVGYMFSK